jgi:hypothetical protein
MGEIVFKDNSIHKGHRIKIPKAIVDTLNLREGEKIKISLMLIKKDVNRGGK